MRSKFTVMSEPRERPALDDRLPNGGRPTGPCEIQRALTDIEAGTTTPRVGPCSADPPEERSFPPAPAGETPYYLCNAHLRDVFEALDRSRAKLAPH
jgi:hypothetical protein